jgi:hypothetical protein
MKIILFMLLVTYVAAWLIAFLLPIRKGRLSAFAFIPAAFCAFFVPMFISDILRHTPTTFLVIWSIIPVVVVGIKLILRARAQDRNSIPYKGKNK